MGGIQSRANQESCGWKEGGMGGGGSSTRTNQQRRGRGESGLRLIGSDRALPTICPYLPRGGKGVKRAPPMRDLGVKGSRHRPPPFRTVLPPPPSQPPSSHPSPPPPGLLTPIPPPSPNSPPPPPAAGPPPLLMAIRGGPFC